MSPRPLDVHNNKSHFRDSLVPESNDQVDVGLEGQRWNVGRFKTLIANTIDGLVVAVSTLAVGTLTVTTNAILSFLTGPGYLKIDSSEQAVVQAVPIPIADGGTGAITASAARTALDVPSNAEAILDTLVDAKGDLIVATAADTVARQAVGANRTQLRAKSSTASGLIWGLDRVFDVVVDHGAVGDGVADDTTEIQAAIDAAAAVSGVVYFPPGNYSVSALDVTETNGLTLRGAGTQASFIVANVSSGNLVDATGATNLRIIDIQIGGGSAASFSPAVGLLLATNAPGAGNLAKLENINILGKWTVAALYVYGHTLGSFINSHFYNYSATAGTRVVALTASNLSSITSAFATIDTGTVNPNSFEFFGCSIQEHVNNGTTIEDAIGLTLDGANDIHFYGGEQFGSLGTQYSQILGTCAGLLWDGYVWEDGAGGLNDFVFTITNASISNFAIRQSNVNFGTSLFNGTPTIFNAASGNFFIGTRSSPDVTIATNTTSYLGTAGHSTAADAAASFAIPQRGILNALYVQSSAAPGATETYTYTVMLNGGATALAATISNTDVLANDQVDPIAVAPNDRASVRVVTSDGSAVQQHMASVGFMPY